MEEQHPTPNNRNFSMRRKQTNSSLNSCPVTALTCGALTLRIKVWFSLFFNLENLNEKRQLFPYSFPSPLSCPSNQIQSSPVDQYIPEPRDFQHHIPSSHFYLYNRKNPNIHETEISVNSIYYYAGFTTYKNIQKNG